MQPLEALEPNHHSQALLSLSNPGLPTGLSNSLVHHVGGQLNPMQVTHQLSSLMSSHDGHQNVPLGALSIPEIQDHHQKRTRDEYEDQSNPHGMEDKSDLSGSSKRKKSGKGGRKLRSPTKHFTKEEDDEIIHLQTLYDNDWAQILKHSRLLQNNGRHVESIAHHVRYLTNRNKEKIDEKDKKKDKPSLTYNLDGAQETLEQNMSAMVPNDFLNQDGQYPTLNPGEYNHSGNQNAGQQGQGPLGGITLPPMSSALGSPVSSNLNNKKKRADELVHPTAERRILEQIRTLKESITKLKKELKQERKDRKQAQDQFEKLVETTQGIERLLTVLYAHAPQQQVDNHAHQQRTA